VGSEQKAELALTYEQQKNFPAFDPKGSHFNFSKTEKISIVPEHG
jgi:hypothetical protein